MAEAGTIASKLTLDGEQEYKKALSEAYRSLRVLRSELKAETAELGRNASQQDKARTKISSLQKQIEQQKKVVETLKKALEDSKKQYADNQEVQDKWAEKLNKAREALAKLQMQMEDSTDELKDFSEGMKDAADESGDAATKVVSLNDSIKSIGQLIGGIGSDMSGIFSASYNTMETIVNKMMELMGKAWATASDWQRIQSIWGGSLEDIEKVFTGASLQGVESGDITSGIQKLVTNTHAGNKDTVAALKKLGIEEENYSSHWDYYMDVMQHLADLAAKDKDAADKLTTAIFGDKSGSNQRDVVGNWNEMMQKYQTDVEDTGLKLYDDEIQKLDEVSHKVEEIKSLWDTIKTNIGAKLSDILDISGISDDTLNILRTIGKIFNETDEEKKAELVVSLEESIKSLIEKISTAMENAGGWLQEIGGSLKTSDNSLIGFIGELMEKAGGLLDWLGEHGTELTDMLTKLLPWIMTNKLSEAVTGKGLGQWATDILNTGLSFWQISLLGKGFGTAAQTALGAETAGSALGAAAQTAFGAKTIGGTIGSTITSAIKMALPVIGLMAAVEIVKKIPANLQGKIAEAFGLNDPTLEQVESITEGQTMGDVMQKVQDTPQAENKKTMDFALDALWKNSAIYRAWQELFGGGQEQEPEPEPEETGKQGSFPTLNLETGEWETEEERRREEDAQRRRNTHLHPYEVMDFDDPLEESVDGLTDSVDNLEQTITQSGEKVNRDSYYDEDEDLLIEEVEFINDAITDATEEMEDIYQRLEELENEGSDSGDDDDTDINIEDIWGKMKDASDTLRAWLADKYKGGEKTDTPVKIEMKSEVHSPVYLDGALIADYVSQDIANKFVRLVGG